MAKEGYDKCAKRFMDSAENLGLFRSTNVNNLKPFYEGEFVTQRMAKIREYILYIRHNWNKRDRFVETLQNVMQGLNENVDRNMKHCLKQKTDWKDDSTEICNQEFDLLRLYTSEAGYNEIFSLINSIFRREDSLLSEDRILSAVFLVELINIALFNYVTAFPERNNFQGIVYRGMSVNKEDFDAFTSLRSNEIKDRYISIPLLLMSTSLDLKVAENFVMKAFAEKQDATKAVIFKIHVIELNPRHLEYYRQRFPSSVVSTICAVQIDDLSVHDESEVLLRGPFFQVLDLYNDVVKGWPLLEIVTVNTNRDHISTAFLGKDDAFARALFGTMAAVSRYEFALKYCEQKGLKEDAQGYCELLEDTKSRLSKLMED